jgi:hypothetical protein
MQTISERQVGIPGVAGFCLRCSRRTIVHVISVGSFCAMHYLEYVDQYNAPITPELKEHYREVAQNEQIVG